MNANLYFYFGDDTSLSTCKSWGFGCTPHLDEISPKKGTLLHLKWHLSVFSLRFSPWHFCIHSFKFSIMIMTGLIVSYNYNTIFNAIHIGQILEYFACFIEMCSLLVLHRMAVYFICTFKIGMKMWLGMVTFCLT